MGLGRGRTRQEYADSGCKNDERNACSQRVVSSGIGTRIQLECLGMQCGFWSVRPEVGLWRRDTFANMPSLC